MIPAGDDLTATLDRIRKRSEWASDRYAEMETVRESADDVPPLLAALRAVLELADRLEPQGPPSSALEEDRMFIRQECADMIREAISREITGKEESDA